jgi:hypothetical protein
MISSFPYLLHYFYIFNISVIGVDAGILRLFTLYGIIILIVVKEPPRRENIVPPKED